MNTSSAWWPLIREILLFLVGTSVLVVETTHPQPRTVVILVGMALAGYPVLSLLDRVFGGSK